MISVIIPVYNQADKLGDCLESLAFQTIKDFEIIVIDDGSTDNPVSVVNAVRVKYPESIALNGLIFKQQSNSGAPAARNNGFKEAQGEYILFCDSDLVLEPDCLETMLAELKKRPTLSYVYCSFYYGAKLFKAIDFNTDKLKQTPYIHTSSMIKSEDFLGFDETLKRFQDWDLWLTLLEVGKVGQAIRRPLYRAQIGGHISSWLPKAAYKYLPFLPEVKRYNKAKQIIIKKHNL